MSATVKWGIAGAVLLALVLFFVLRPQGATPPPAPKAAAAPSETNKLSFTTADEIVSFERDAAGWHIASPLRAKADGAAVDALIARLNTLTTDREASPDRTKAAEFGLVTPAVTIRLSGTDTKGQSQEKAWLIGNEGPNGTTFAVEGDPRIFFGPPGFKALVAQPLDELRDRSLVAYQPREARGLFLLRADGTSWLVERGPEGWKRVKPNEGPADATVVDGILTRLREAKALEYMDDRRPTTADGLGAYGLDKAAATVTILLPGDKSETLLVGVAGEGANKRVYARIAAGGPVMLVDGAILEELQKEP
jgi:hypothetical protein